MKITSGLFDHMVLQRNRWNVSEAEFEGECAAAGSLKALVKGKAGALKTLQWVTVGKVSPRGRMSGRLAGIPVGGPYDIELRVEGSDGRALDSLRIKDVLVGDVWVLGGQSNMQGSGGRVATPRPDPRVRAWYTDDAWRVAVEPIHNMYAAIDPIHKELCGGVPSKVVSTGPGVFFAKEMLRRTGIPQGLIACAHGGSSMAQWDPKLKKLGGGSLYGAMLRRFRKNGGKVAGAAWYQGESEAMPDAAPLYLDKMKAFVRAMRRDFGDARLPFVAVQIARTHYEELPAPSWNRVQEMQRRLPEAIEECAVVPAIDLPLGDLIHLDAESSQERLGKRIAQAMAVLKFGARAGKPPIALRKVSLVNDPLSAQPPLVKVVVEFDNVVGSLRSGSRPYGFEAGNPPPGNAVYNVRLEGTRAIISLTATRLEAESMLLYYGYGSSPYCNITDFSDRSLPVFGPIRLGRTVALTPFVRTCRVSKFLPRAGRLEGLAYPTDPASLEFRERTFDAKLRDLRLEIGPRVPEDPLVYFACRLNCSEPMKLAARIGYGGPVKVWVDGREEFYDPNGTTPAWADMKTVPFAASAGAHEVLVALGGRACACGIFLRFARLDVPLRLLEKGPEAYAMPTIIP